MKSIALSLLLFLYWPVKAQLHQVSFEAQADARQVVLGSYFEVSFTLSNAEGSDFRPPSFKDFIQLNKTPSQSTSVTGINGQWTRTVTYSYNLQPKKVGKFIIGEASITVEGKILRTEPITIEVLKGKDDAASTQQDLDDKLAKEVYIKAELSTDEAYLGQQVVLDYKLYTSVNIENYNITSESEYPGFFAQEVRRYHSRVIREVIDGVQYSTKVLKRVALFPQQTGLLVIDPIYMQLGVAVDNNRRSQSFFFNKKIKPLPVQSQELKINVKPLPAGAPTAFSGAVGQYSINSTVSRTNLTTDDALSLRMTITGNGDIKRVRAPELVLPDTFEVYEPKIIDESSLETGGQLRGQKVVEYLILPKESGNFEIRPAFSYFDPDSLNYVIANPEIFHINVREGTARISNLNVSPKGSGNQADIRYIKLETQLQKGHNKFFGSNLFWVLLLLPFASLIGVIIHKRVQQQQGNIDVVVLRRNRAQKIAKKRLAQAKEYMQQVQSRSFYDEVSRASFGYVCDKLNIPLVELSKANVEEKLRQLEVSPPSIEEFMKVLQTCEMALFAGKDNASSMQDTYQTAVDVISRIEEQLGKRITV